MSASPPRAKEPRYLPLVKVGSGAYATVYVALDQRPFGVRGLVAMKALHPHLAEESAQRQALIREARLLACVRHAHVVELKDVDDEDGVRLVLGYVEGVTFGKWLVDLAQRDERLEPNVVVQIGLDAASGLHAIHEARSEADRPLSLVHRDVSPQNLLVGLDGISKLSDFGTAKVLFEPASETTEGSLKGKLGYMAPEYIRGAPVDRRIDVFALGVVLWEGFSGKRLFRGTNEGETLERVLHAAVPKLGELDEALAPFDAVISKALARDPTERFSTALELGHELARAAKRAGLDPDHEAVARALARAFDPELGARREAIAEAIAKNAAASGGLTEATATLARDEDSAAAPKREASSRWAIGAGILALGGALAGGGLFLRNRLEAQGAATHPTNAADDGASRAASDLRTSGDDGAASSSAPTPSAGTSVSASGEPATPVAAHAAPVNGDPSHAAAAVAKRRKPPPNPY